MPEERRVWVADRMCLHVRHTAGPLGPDAPVHGLASHARLWDGVAHRIGDHAQHHGRPATDLRRLA